MKKILVLNSGSSSLKYQLFEMSGTNCLVIAKGVAERIGEKEARLILKTASGNTVSRDIPFADHHKVLEQIFGLLVPNCLKHIDDLSAVGHRLGHGGEYFDQSVIINGEVMEKIYASADLLPLHGKAFILGIEAINRLLPQIPQVAVFDSAFHQTMPAEAYLYALPPEQYKTHRIRRYGFHGTSHYFVTQKAAQYLGKNGKFISCHLGNGSSIAAVKDGKSIDTSMGFGGMTGLIMGTRCGDLDPYIPLYIMKTQNKTADDVNTMLNRESGLYALSGGYKDRRDIEKLYHQGNPQAVIALNCYIYNIVKYIGAYTAVLNGADAIIFTAGIGENSDFVRQKICEHLAYMGITLDSQANCSCNREVNEISTPDSKVKVLVIPTNEELVIAQDTYRLITKL